MSLVITGCRTGALIRCTVVQVTKLIGVLIVVRFDTLEGNKILQLDPAVDGVFTGPYPIGIDPVSIFLCNLYSLYSAVQTSLSVCHYLLSSRVFLNYYMTIKNKPLIIACC